jgi:hypothetical protein
MNGCAEQSGQPDREQLGGAARESSLARSGYPWRSVKISCDQKWKE